MPMFDYLQWDEKSEKVQQEIKLFFVNIELSAKENLKPSRELSLAMTNLEQAWMWMGKAIKADQISRTTAKG